MRRSERSWHDLPVILLVSFAIIFSIQVFLHHQAQSKQFVSYQPLSKPFSSQVYKDLSMGSEKLLSFLLAIRLQLHDNQAGRHVRYRNIDYSLLVDWLNQISQINPDSEYTMLLASRVFSQIYDKSRLRILLEYIDETFSINPQLHWRRQAEATVIAKHQLDDLEFALAMAERLSNQPENIKIPRWARDLHFLLLGDLNEFESAILIIRALLEDGSITNNDEVRFLKEKLLYFQQKLSESKHS